MKDGVTKFFIFLNSWECISKDVSHTLIRLPKILHKVFEASLTKGNLKTSSCPCVASFKRNPIPMQFCLCTNNYLLLIPLQNWLDITQDEGIHYQMILMSRTLSWVEGHLWFPFFVMSSCTFFRCVVNIYFATCDFLHFPTLQGHFEPFLTHSTLFLASWRRGKPPRI